MVLTFTKYLLILTDQQIKNTKEAEQYVSKKTVTGLLLHLFVVSCVRRCGKAFASLEISTSALFSRPNVLKSLIQSTPDLCEKSTNH